MNWSAQPMTSTFGFTVQIDGIGMIIRKASLKIWADKIRASGAKRAWVYFNNDYEGFAPKNALTMRRLLLTTVD